MAITGVERIAQRARQESHTRYTALMHHFRPKFPQLLSYNCLLHKAIESHRWVYVGMYN